MQTLTRLMARLWNALFPASRPLSYKTGRSASGRQRATNAANAANSAQFAAGDASSASLSERRLWPLLRSNRLPTVKDSDDTTFCSWMYHLY